MTDRKPRKPTGEIGPVCVTPGENEAVFEKVEFPKDKVGIENLIVSQFKGFWEKQTGNAINITPNHENDLDFTIHFPSGDVLLELTEIVFPSSGGPPYNDSQTVMATSDFVEQALKTIGKKQYESGGQPKHLLCYITHGNFWPSETAIQLLQHDLRAVKHPFENIFLLIPLDAVEATVRCLFPLADAVFTGFDPDAARKTERLILDPKNFQVVFKKG